MIQAKIVAGSRNPFNDKKLVTFQISLPRIILAELNTHRMLVSNASSSRAIPFSKKVEAVSNDPFIPIAWQKSHSGMQGSEYHTDKLNIEAKNGEWLIARNHAINQATQLDGMGVTKQLCNRLLEPFEYIDVVISGTEWENFFSLRCPAYYGVYRSQKDLFVTDVDKRRRPFHDVPNSSQAEIHIQALAELMWDAYNGYDYKMLEPGEWHIPFEETISDESIWPHINHEDEIELIQCKVATAICARGSYGKFEGKSIEDDIKLHDRLLAERHMSPFSHSAKCPTHDEYEKYSDTKYVGQDKPRELGWFSQFHGFMSYRYQLERNLI